MIIKKALSNQKPNELFLNLHRLKKDFGKIEMIIQLVNPEIIVSERQLLQAYINTKDAFNNRTNRAVDYSNEFLLWLACDDNFDTAIKKAGIKKITQFFYIIVESKNSEKEEKELLAKSIDILGLVQLSDVDLKPNPVYEKQVLEDMAVHKLERMKN
ncbi:hypothetical protein J7J26_01465 [Candidatus Micrarchaeota archaeon]|nr:hypothetical protein [Candidatus Micrarchaeota archaeon]